MTNFAPVLIPTLNRFNHFVRCIDSLVSCTYAKKTDLYIALDYPANETHWIGYLKIKKHIEKLHGFKSITIIERNVNLGSEQNSKESMKSIFIKYDKLILIEDDNVFAPSFLSFVNKGLDIYKDRIDIFSVTGYNSPFPMPIWYQKDAYLRTAFTGWGVGIWRNKWEKVNWTLNNFKSILSTKEIFKILKKDYQRYLPQLLRIRDTGHITGDGLIFLYLLYNNMYSIYPVKTRVRNTGHDGSGVNCGTGGVLYLNQQVYMGMEEPNLPANIKVDKRLTKYIIKQIQPSFMYKIKIRIPETIKVKIKKYLKI